MAGHSTGVLHGVVVQWPTRLRLAAVGMVAAFTPATCGGGDDQATGTTAPGAEQGRGSAGLSVTVTAVDIDFPQTEFRARAGEVTIRYENEGQIRHTLVVEGVAGWETLEVEENGDVDEGRITLEPGTYVLFCEVPGHRPAGMEGRLVVE